MSRPAFRKYRHGTSGAYSDEYHALLGKSTWIVVRRLLRHPLSTTTASGGTSGDTAHAAESDATPQTSRATRRSELSEGDIATVFSQFGEVTDVRFVRYRKTGRFLGTAFVQFADYRSAILAADEMNSDVEAKQFVTLVSAGSDGGREAHNHATPTAAQGIVVERCEEAEVPAMYSPQAMTYPQWLRQCRKAA